MFDMDGSFLIVQEGNILLYSSKKYFLICFFSVILLLGTFSISLNLLAMIEFHILGALHDSAKSL